MVYKYVEYMHKNNKNTTKIHRVMKKYKHIERKGYINQSLFVNIYKNRNFNKNALTMHKNESTIQP